MTESQTLYQLAQNIKTWGKELGFADIGISSIDLNAYETEHLNWLQQGFHGQMDYMSKHGTKRTRPEELEPGTLSIISARMNYFDTQANSPINQLQENNKAYISRYALNKDYHKLIRKRLQQLTEKISKQFENFQYRAFCDSAPVLERPIAEQAGLGFIGKNSLVIHPRAGSWFFLGEIYCNLPLPADSPFEKQGCGPCTACLDECPTQAIVDDKVVDARKCISYLTIEYDGIIDESLRPLMGNRIYGCDDCQLVCPWNKFTEQTQEAAFTARYPLDQATLLELLNWDESTFYKQLEGSPIRRIGFDQWQRNLCIAIGNDDYSPDNIKALQKLTNKNTVVKTHRDWALQQQETKQNHSPVKRFSKIARPAIAPKYYLPKQ